MAKGPREGKEVTVRADALFAMALTAILRGGLHGSIESTPLLVAGADEAEAEGSDDEEEGEEALTPRQVVIQMRTRMDGD